MNVRESLLSHVRQRETSAQNYPSQSTAHPHINKETHPHSLEQQHIHTHTHTHKHSTAQSQSQTQPQLQPQTSTRTSLKSQMHTHNNTLTHPHTNPHAHTQQIIDSRVPKNRNNSQNAWGALRCLWGDSNKQTIQRINTQVHTQDHNGEIYRSTAPMSDMQANNGQLQQHAITRSHLNTSSHTDNLFTDNTHMNEHTIESQVQQWTTTGGTFSPITGILSADGFYIPAVCPKPQIDNRRNPESAFATTVEKPNTENVLQAQRSNYTNFEANNRPRPQVNVEECRNTNLENNQKVVNSEKKLRRKVEGQMKKEDTQSGTPHFEEGRSNQNFESNSFDKQETTPAPSRSHVSSNAYTHTTRNPDYNSAATVPRFDLNPNAPEFVPQWNKPKSSAKGKKHLPSHSQTHTHTQNHMSRAAAEGKDMNARKSGEFDVWAREMAL